MALHFISPLLLKMELAECSTFASVITAREGFFFLLLLFLVLFLILELKSLLTFRSARTCTGNEIFSCQRSLKGFAVNPVNPNYLAFACEDQFVRICDRRVGVGKNLVLKMEPGGRVHKFDHVTNVQYSACGTQILANYSGECSAFFDWRLLSCC